jgi:hypothetical protein
MSTLQRLKPTFAAAMTTEFRAGGPPPDLARHVEPTDEDFDPDLIRALFTAALELDKPKAELDSWLAPRFHYLFRISRRTASDRGVWAWLAATICRQYVMTRFAGEGPITPMRYYGELLRNAVSRLWWGAEMVRNGPSYEYVPIVFSRVRTAEFALELRYSWYRPAAIAFTRVAEGVGRGKRLSDEEMKDLSKSVNAYLSLTALESIGLNEDENGLFDEDWRQHGPSLAEATGSELSRLVGPQDGVASRQALDGLDDWFRRIGADMGMQTL